MRTRWLLLCGFMIVALVAGGLVLSWRPALPAISPPLHPTFGLAQIARGRELAALGDCMVCHTAKNGRPFAGGRPIQTPFGTIYSTNITPDPRTGIGQWSLAAFARAMREGIARDGTHLYPAFPYDHFAQSSETDIAALYAFLATREPVRAAAPKNLLPFPFNIRALLAGWNLLYLHRTPFRPDPTRSADWNRGAYLVQTIAHCGACHTPHNALGAEETDRALAGGVAERWYAPPLGAQSPAPVPWTADQISNYLRTGIDSHHGAAAGPMRPVAQELAMAPQRDVRAIAAYIASLMPRKPPPRTREAATDRRADHVFEGACAACHDSTRWPSLSNATTLVETLPRDAIEIVLNGMPWRGGAREDYMPSFAATLTDAQTAEILNYLRARFAGRAPWNDAQAQVRRIRAEPQTP